MQVMLDRDLAILYGITTKALNQAYKRNKERFPEQFAFTLSENELHTLRSQIVTLEKKNVGKGTHSKYLPTVYTEYGIAMLSAVLKTEKAVAISIEIIEFFVRVRHMIRSGELMIHRIDSIEKRLIGYDLKFDEIDQFIQKTKLPQHGIFFDNQIFDAYNFSVNYYSAQSNPSSSSTITSTTLCFFNFQKDRPGYQPPFTRSELLKHSNSTLPSTTLSIRL
jgi:hypothetical protein